MTSTDRTPSAAHGKLTARKKLLFAIVTLSAFFIGAFLALETGYRAYKAMRPGRIPAGEFERTLGWSPSPGKHISQREKFGARNHDEAWAEGVESFYRIDENGFRRRDPDENPGPVVFLLGDSFTEAGYAGIGGTYYDRLTKEVPCRLHVFGSTGYGTLQQTLVLERYISGIRPKIVVLQMCSNDLYDNDPDLAGGSLNWNPGQPRPFLNEDGTIVMREIRYDGPGHLLLSRSQFLQYLVRRFRLVKWRSPFDYQESPYFEQAVRRTGQILKRFRKSCGDETIVLAYAECAEPDETIYRKLCQEAGITYLDGVSGALRDEERKAGNPELGRHDGPAGHYNLFGHHVIGKALEPHLSRVIGTLK